MSDMKTLVIGDIHGCYIELSGCCFSQTTGKCFNWFHVRGLAGNIINHGIYFIMIKNAIETQEISSK
jgi:hypothetical protein